MEEIELGVRHPHVKERSDGAYSRNKVHLIYNQTLTHDLSVNRSADSYQKQRLRKP